MELCEQNISRNAWARVIIFSAQIVSKNFGKILKYLTELSPFSDFVILCSKATLWTKYLENRLS